MKTKIKLLGIAIIMGFNVAYAQTSPDEQSLKSLLSKSNLSSDESTHVYDGLSHIIENKNSISTKELLEMCLSYSKLENSDAPYDLIYNLKRGNPVEFEKALKELSPEKRTRIIEIINISEYEETHGNG